jgi:hypothetical protein
MIARLATILFVGLLCFSTQAQAAPCTAGVTTCTTDSSQDTTLVAAMTNSVVQERVYQLWIQQCLNVYSEAGSTVGHQLRAAYCGRIANNNITKELLVAVVMTPTVQSEVISVSAGCQTQPGGCMVDADVVTAIGAALTVTVNLASTTATAAIGSTTLTVASATGIITGQRVYGAGIPGGTVVDNVSGTSIAINNPTAAALSATSVLFSLVTGLPQ